MCSLDDLEVIGVLLWSDEIMADQEIDQDHAAVWLELAFVQCLNDLGKGSELLISATRGKLHRTDRKGFHFIVMRLWANVLGITLRREL
jgi:hypothetical protein